MDDYEKRPVETPSINLESNVDDIKLFEEQQLLHSTVKHLINEFVQLSDQIKQHQEEIKRIKTKKTEIQSTIIEFMKENHLTAINFNQSGNSIKFTGKTSKKVLSKTTILDHFKDRLGEIPYKRILDDMEPMREDVYVESLRLVKN